MHTHLNLARFFLVLSIVFFFLSSNFTLAHPEDEFCEGAILDPALCAQLAELDRAQSTTGNSTLPEIELDRSFIETAFLYVKLGFEHIIPMGLDHLAFVLALILSARALKPLLIQISVFTLAHSVTLVLGVLDIVALNSKWVEIAIAFSIVFVALENIFIKHYVAWRTVIVFSFGLLHGLGFAGALSDLGVPTLHFAGALIGFNLGVELGQLLFGLVFFLLLHKAIKKPFFNKYIFLPCNLGIAAIGTYWLIERVF